jgi:hypothetical protein
LIRQGGRPSQSSIEENNAADTQVMAAICLDSYLLESMPAEEVIFVPRDLVIFILVSAVD